MSAKQKEPDKSKVLLVEDHPVMRQGLVMLIEQENDLTVCGEAEDVHGALEAIDQQGPNIVVVDISLKESSGLELIKDIKVRWPDLAVLVLSMHDESFYAERALRAGARGYVTKAEASAKVIDGIRQVLSGNVYVSEKVASKMLTRLVGAGTDLEKFPIDSLSDREFQIFELIGQGVETRDIAKQLHVSVKTVEAHREHIKKKLNLDSATELLKYAVQWVQFEREA